jgi:hypothetical protein
MNVPDRSVSLVSEDDIRTRVVAIWLFEHGFSAESISVEFSFELRLGRTYTESVRIYLLSHQYLDLVQMF